MILNIKWHKAFIAGVLLVSLLVGMFITAPVAKAESNRDAMLAQIQQLLTLITSLQQRLLQMEDSSSSEGGFSNKDISIGSRVQTTDLLKVRAGATTGANWINNIAAYTGGKVINGPRYADGYTWWHVEYDNGTSGWSVGNWLKKLDETNGDEESENSSSVFSAATCSVNVNKTEYVSGEQIKISWTSKNADEIWFEGDGVANLLDLPLNNVSNSGSKSVSAQGKGKLTIKMKVEDDEGNSNTCARTITVKPASVSLTTNGSDTAQISVGPDETIEVLYFPNGYIETCDVVANYSGGDYPVTHEWNKYVTKYTSDYGRAYFNAVGVYKGEALGALVSVEVTCGVKGSSDVSDKVTVNVSDGGNIGSYLIEVDGDTLASGTGAMKIDAINQCNLLIDTYQTVTGREVLKCYWDGDLIKENTAWKG